MAGSTPNVRLRARIEAGIRLVGPVLDLVLAIGDRVTGLLERDDPEYVPARMTHAGEAAPRGLRAYSRPVQRTEAGGPGTGALRG